DDFSFDPTIDQSKIFPEGIRITSFRELNEPESIMSMTSAVSFSIEADPSVCARLILRIDEGVSLVKKGKDGKEKVMSSRDAIISCEHTDTRIDLILPAAGGVRIDALVSQIADDPYILAKCRILKNAQLASVKDGYVPIM
ncbi:MAG TPA: hypothetical protein VF857_04485, partial [Spirochaetota bacterium]